jgi:broad specificity phosphatase PhoE
MLEGNGTVNWADPRLTDVGIKQVEVIRDTWVEQMNNGIPLPQSYYTSPLLRCLETADITFGSLPLPGSRPFGATIKEVCPSPHHLVRDPIC